MSWKLAEWRWRRDAGLSDDPFQRWGSLEAMRKRNTEQDCEDQMCSAEEGQESEIRLPEEHRSFGNSRVAGHNSEFRCGTRLSINTSQPSPPPPHRSTHRASCASPSSVTPLLQACIPCPLSSAGSPEYSSCLESPSSFLKLSSGREISPVDLSSQQARDFFRPSSRPTQTSDRPRGKLHVHLMVASDRTDI